MPTNWEDILDSYNSLGKWASGGSFTFTLDAPTLSAETKQMILGEPIREVPKWLRVEKIICSGPCTIVFWQDNTKTIVRLKEGDQDDLDAAFAQAVVKKLYGSTSKAHRVVDEALVVTNEK